MKILAQIVDAKMFFTQYEPTPASSSLFLLQMQVSKLHVCTQYDVVNILYYIYHLGVHQFKFVLDDLILLFSR